jgi:hypothetical protein
VLVKADKLYPHELEILRMRFALARKDRQLKSALRRVQLFQAGAPNAHELAAAEETQLDVGMRELDEIWDFILACNRPTVLPTGGFERLRELGQLTVEDGTGAVSPLLSPKELDSLRIPRGSLSESERREIESHVTHTYRFLSIIPWTRALRRVPDIAFAHHERADGTGYPRAMTGAVIPVQSKMMAICDVYDALTAADRPYKKAIPHVKALDILHAEAKDGKLDSELLRIFVESEVPQRVLGSKESGAGAGR